MQLVACQLDIVWEDRAANLNKVRAMLATRRPAPGSLIALPEMFAVGFSMNEKRIAEPADGPTAQFLGEMARAHRSWVIGGIAVRAEDGRSRNTAVIASPDGTIGASYVKLHPFALGGEREHYIAGDEIVTAQCGQFTVAPFVCYDLRFPEIFRLATKRGAQLFTVIANWPEARVEHWVTLLRARAIEDQAYVAGVNRCGSDPTLRYPGRSLIIDPGGEVLADAGTGEGVIIADADASRVDQIRRSLPFLQDMRRWGESAQR